MSLHRKIRVGLLTGESVVVSGFVLRIFAERLSRNYMSSTAWSIDSTTLEMWRDLSFALFLVGLTVTAISFHQWLQVEG